MEDLVYRGHIQLSDNNLPLCTEIIHLFSGFPYERNVGPIAFWLKPWNVVGMIAIYLILKQPLMLVCSKWGINGKSTFYKRCEQVHNLLLILFSGCTWWNSWYIIASSLTTKGEGGGFHRTYCDNDANDMWNTTGFGYWATLFYLSKYYEFLDTIVLIIKGKKPSVLQIYHHAGIAYTMWGSTVTQGAWIAWVVCLNSMIHTLMYTYFFLSSCNWLTEGIRKKAKILTTMQIGQFIMGIVGTFGVQFMGNACDTPASRFILAGIQIYAIGLIILFGNMYRHKYNAKRK